MNADIQQAMKKLQANTAIARMMPVFRGMLRNIGTLEGKRDVSHARLVPGSTVICAGAGPSLDNARPFLREARRKGVPVVAAAPAARALGWDVDVAVSVEAVGGSKAVPPRDVDVFFATHLCASPEAWERADGFFGDYYPHSTGILRLLGARPVYYPGNLGPAVVGLALSMGAERVVLVGFDLAYTGGKAYASGAPWEGTKLRQDGKSLVFEHLAERQEAHRESGSAEIPAVHEAVTLPAWGGVGEVVTTYDYYTQIESLQIMAQSFAGEAELCNATGGGAHLKGWVDLDAETVFGNIFSAECTDPTGSPWEERIDHCPVVTAAHVEAVKELLRMQETRIRNAAIDELEHHGVHGAWRNWMIGGGFPMGSALCMPDFTALAQQRPGVSPESIQARYVVMKAAADELAGWVGA